MQRDFKTTSAVSVCKRGARCSKYNINLQEFQLIVLQFVCSGASICWCALINVDVPEMLELNDKTLLNLCMRSNTINAAHTQSLSLLLCNINQSCVGECSA